MTDSKITDERDRLIHILVVHFDMFRDKAEEVADLFLHDKTLASRRQEPVNGHVREILNAVAHVGVDFGYGPYVLEEKFIKAAQQILEGQEAVNEPAELATSGSAAEYSRDQIARLAFAIYYSANLCAPQNIAAVIEEIDTCGNDCEHVSGSTCYREQAGKFCAFSVAEDLRQLSAALYGEKEPRGYIESVFGPDRMPALRAASIPKEPGVKVKPLIWRPIGPGASDVEAETPLGVYTMSFDAPTAGGAVNLWMAGADNDTFTVHERRKVAVAAAQADYEQRILSSLQKQEGGE